MPTHKPKPKSPPREADDPEQYRRFVEMARKVETDETPGAFDRAFDQVVPVTNSKNGETRMSKAPGRDRS